jgi:hypothetical protein
VFGKNIEINLIINRTKSGDNNMSKIQIENLQTAGSDLFQGGESFLTELQATEAHTIFGGSSGKKKKDKYGPSVVVIQPQPPIFVPVPFPVYPGFPCNPAPRPCGC